MAITILEAMKLPTLKDFELIAGYRGLDREIQRASILDYEYEKSLSDKPIQTYFEKEDFVISSLIYAKDDPSLILESVKGLVSDGVSGLAVKNIYYDVLPEEVIKYANQMDFPIFIFDKKGSYYEDIVTEIYDKNKEKNSISYQEAKIGILLKEDMDKSSVKNMAKDFNISFKENMFSICLKPKKYIDENSLTNIINILNRDLGASHVAYRYHGIIFIICTYEDSHKENKSTEFSRLVRLMIYSLFLDLNDYYIGISNFHKYIDELNFALKESMYAMRTASIEGENIRYYYEIGVYKLLMPSYSEGYMINFYSDTIGKIKHYDQKYNSELLQTATVYVKLGGNIKNTAKSINLHENTVRYRINKIKEIFNTTNSEFEFYEELALGIKLHLIHQNI
ncbi:PucR family transcriptional regulator [Intestinibacter bartlettii]|uniref:PucR family transcriptional regulator n=1 Tax=Intestinibacter bartlettii TaxID=261299 RepID=UPI001D11E938|nr:PucR family transcriptional regulator ligand-binding domain-containing protein [Intestinibacter bartlettii]MCC2707128.1 PucR family transcriptional regulator ligand-binding domain-containing protein [Intestinibacter bartlettii]MCC2762577.1 PucR family transcriptional regulator ligand-binding domain-containing protein [Intestinibacter bartlettii]MDU2164040.1 PucR family transcriptional regulator ligand-binding domain-containing protein [Intestinibacter bartlettii]MDU6473678.1 PucR family tran